MDEVLAHIPAADAQRLRGVTAVRTATQITRLGGGITNRNYHVVGPTGEAVVRLSDPDPSDLAIDREHEYLNSVAAARSGAAPEVVDYLAGAGLLVVAWVEGRTFTEEDVADPAVGRQPEEPDAGAVRERARIQLSLADDHLVQLCAHLTLSLRSGVLGRTSPRLLS